MSIDKLTASLTAFNTFKELCDCAEASGYCPTLHRLDGKPTARLAMLFDRAMVDRGLKNRAWRGTPIA